MAVVSKLSVQDVYGSRSGASPRISSIVTPGATRQPSSPSSSSDPSGGRLGATIARSSPVYGLIVLVLFAVLLRFAATQVGTPEEFKNIKVNPWNAIVITITALIGLFLLKIAMVFFPIPHVSTVIMGA